MKTFYLQNFLLLHFPIVEHSFPVKFVHHGETVLLRFFDNGQNGIFSFVLKKAVNIRVADGLQGLQRSRRRPQSLQTLRGFRHGYTLRAEKHGSADVRRSGFACWNVARRIGWEKEGDVLENTHEEKVGKKMEKSRVNDQ